MSVVGPRSLRLHLGAAFVVVALVPAVLLGAYAAVGAHSEARRRVAGANELVAGAVAGEVERFLEAQLLDVRQFALHLAAAHGAGGSGRGDHLAAHLAANPAVKSVLLLDASGRVELAAPADPDLVGVDFSGQPWWRRAQVDLRPTWSSAAISLQTGQPTVTLVLPGRDHSVVGYLDLEVLRGIAERRGREAHVAEVAVLDADGTFIAHPDGRLVRERVNVRALPLVRGALLGAAATAEIDLLGRPSLASAAPVPANGWVVLVSEPLRAALEPVRAARDGLLAALGVALVLSLGGALLVARRLVRPIEALAAGARALAAGEAPRPLPRGGVAETNDLASAFEGMAAAVRAREEALARSELSYRRLVDAPLVAVIRTALDGRILFANEAAARMVGAPSTGALLGTDVGSFYADPAEQAAFVERLRAEGRVVSAEVRLRRLDGAPLVALANLALDGDVVSSVLVDVTAQRAAATEKERLEEQLRHAQRLEAVGRLAGGVAHDFNNLLTAITGFAAMLAESLPPDHPERESVEGILHSAERGAHLTRSLLAYSRKQVLRPRPLDLRDTVRSVERLARRLLGEDVELVVRLGERRLTVVADPGQLEQVLLNLCTNARDALPRGGTITIAADERAVTVAEARELELLRPGRYARLAVSDTGEGMSPEVRERIFEPFFTTKAAGRGTGLGLAIVYGIVRQHEGAVRVDSAPGRGTTFEVLLPVPPGAEESTHAPLEPVASAPRGRETILVAEDEPLVRSVIRATLERAGYEVLEAHDGQEAVEVFRRHRGRVELCLLDVLMPRLNGKQALEAIQLIDPGARAVFASGYAADVLTTRGVEELGAELVQKPIAPAELLRVVRAALDRVPPTRTAAGPA